MNIINDVNINIKQIRFVDLYLKLTIVLHSVLTHSASEMSLLSYRIFILFFENLTLRFAPPLMNQ